MMVYVVQPESGPMTAIKAWMQRKQEFRCWLVPTDKQGYLLQHEVAKWVLQQAHEEVLAEYGDR
jgi:hypothetical protein